MAHSTKKKKAAGRTAVAVKKERKLTAWGIVGRFGLLLLGCILLGVMTLALTVSSYDMEIFRNYFTTPMIPIVNVAILFGFCSLLYLLTRREWIAYLVTAVVFLAIAIGNYYLIMIRNDPLRFEDLTSLREALNITATQHYELQLSWRVVLSVVLCAGYTVFLALLLWKRPKAKRLWLAAPCAVLVAAAVFLASADQVQAWTKNYKKINTWSHTQIAISRGIVYTFTHSIFSSSSTPPDGYKEKDVEAMLAEYPAEDIPEERKLNIIAVMRESYTDLSAVETTRPEALDFSCYELYHRLQAESYTGTLITNGFGGNTKDAERCFLTGCTSAKDYRSPAQSYVWYLRDQGYYTEGIHPFNGWFYNRVNINRYMGFNEYYFREELFEDTLDGAVAEDDRLYDLIWEKFNDSDPAVPYFSFSVTYEGHGPYNYKKNLYDTRFVLEDADTADGYAMNNYLSCVYKRDQELDDLVRRLTEVDRPVALVVFGDHKPTLGADVNNYTTAAYKTFGMDLDVSSEQGFINYYSTEYLIWLNPAAQALYDEDRAGQTGPMISPCYLMNQVFDYLGLGKGPAFLQAMEEQMQAMPVFANAGRYSVDGHLTGTLTEEARETRQLIRYLNYYRRTADIE